MPEEAKPSNAIQEILGSKITIFVLWGTLSILLVGIVFTYLALTTPSLNEDKIKQAFSILQYILGVLLPLWGTWIGTILAYYYSKQNFEAANKSVQQIVDRLTPEKKLQSVKSKDVMIQKEKLIRQIMTSTENLSKFKLKEDCVDFLAQHKINRVIILDEKDRAKYVIHRDLISFFLTDQMFKGISGKDLTLMDMYNQGSIEIRYTMDNSVKFINSASNLLEAKTIMEHQKRCQDIFITNTGLSTEPILGWITNVTIAENSIV
jgi:hypothetical protein